MELIVNFDDVKQNKIIPLNGIKQQQINFTEWTFENIDSFIKEVLEYARNFYNFNYKNFTFKRNNRLKRAYARCFFARSYIEFSNFLLNNYTDDFVKSVIIHEMCHALSFEFDGEKSKIDHNHDKIFTQMCRNLCNAFNLPDGSRAVQTGTLRSEVIKEKEEIKIVEKVIEIIEKVSFRFIFVSKLNILFLKYATTPSIFNSS